MLYFGIDMENIVLFKFDYINHLLKDSKKVLIGTSGGSDSMALTHQIHQYRNNLSCEFKVLHVNHHINTESNTWAKLVEDYCKSIDMPCEVVEVDITQWGNNLEQAARRSRYDAFSKQNIDTIMLAHHENDQIETFFLKLFRGAGPKGLRCMSETSPCWFDLSKVVIRPLLNCSKTQLEEYVIKHNIPFITDPSNVDNTYNRNWIRNCLMPTIQERDEIADINILKVVRIQNEAYELMNDLATLDLESVSMVNGDLNWSRLKTFSSRRIKNLIMFICTQYNLVDVSIHNVETFSKGLLVADEDSRNELRLRNFRMYKIGKRIVIDSNFG